MIKALLFLFKSKAAITALSMLLSVFAYALIWGWPYAVGFVALIFLHEMGHFIAARQRGLDVGAPTFIPFVGAWIQMKQMPHNAETEAYVGIAGPVAGTAAALACFELSRALDNPLLLALAYSGFMLNLFNLLPLSPLDGGRITAVISPRLWLLGGPVLVALFLWNPSPMFLLIGLLALPSFLAALRGHHVQNEYYVADPRTKTAYTLAYFGLIAYLGVMSYSVHQELAALTQQR